MSFLLDTHVWPWWLLDDGRLSPRARATVADPDNTVFVSAASAWEIATKHRPSAQVLVQDMGARTRSKRSLEPTARAAAHTPGTVAGNAGEALEDSHTDCARPLRHDGYNCHFWTLQLYSRS
ncbi:MAG: type II toxin-antitoxin system VapC family toxin [Proteobacteria bacterium]|nr:type II toxin-antitoxin system VapC family toxin [Pseudomonadota bacterium]